MIFILNSNVYEMYNISYTVEYCIVWPLVIPDTYQFVFQFNSVEFTILLFCIPDILCLLGPILYAIYA